ncbi:MBL fold metallo-hydrolase, partial [Anaerosalibacter bizertensis]|nr:MBL fold metallo-hydrolase [Anaerosalibacter bizertensis]
MAFKFCSLSSGSSGNCQYIETDNIKVLIDAGLSGKRIENLLKDIEVEANTIDCILITHEHTDHIKGAG